MTIPEFTAEASLYTTRTHYKHGAGWADGTGEYPGIPQQAIIPQRLNDHQLKAGGFKSFRRT
jgi:hypothetical protein